MPFPPVRLAVAAIAALVSLSLPARTLAQPVLSLDFGQRTAAGDPVQPGFQSFVLDGGTGVFNGTTTRTYGPLSVALSPTGANITGLDDRLRAVPTNAGALTTSDILRDFIFATHTGTQVNTDEGLNIQVQGLTPGLPYTIRMWSYDNSSNPARISDWFVNNGTTPAFAGYSFTGSTVPTDDNLSSFTFQGTATATGGLLISGRAAAGANASTNSHHVFINALQLAPVPEPTSLALVGLGGLGLAWRARRKDRAARRRY